MLDDFPLGSVGVLRFVNKDVVDLAVELVTHPLAHAGLPQELPRPVDEVVKVGDPGRALGRGISLSECLASTQTAGDVRGKPRAVLQLQHLADEVGEVARAVFILRIELGLSGINALYDL